MNTPLESRASRILRAFGSGTMLWLLYSPQDVETEIREAYRGDDCRFVREKLALEEHSLVHRALTPEIEAVADRIVSGVRDRLRSLGYGLEPAPATARD